MDNKIKRRKVSSNNSYKNQVESNMVTFRYKIENTQINRNEIDDSFELEKELYYKKRDKKRRKRNHIIKKALSFLLAIVVVSTILVTVTVAVSIKGTKKLTKETIHNSYITKNVVPIDEIPDDLKNAIVATEDRRFYEHNGIDIKSLIRSFVNNILSNSTQGGSTIDMQVSKNLLTSVDKTMKRKIVDMYNAIEMNKIMTKDEILEAYLNNIYFGRGSYGVQEAANTYFGKDVRDLNLAECAMLAGITNNPAKFMQYDEAKIRQKVVLNNMYEQGYITEAQYRKAINSSTPFKS